MGLMTAAASIGSTVFPFVAHKLIKDIGCVHSPRLSDHSHKYTWKISVDDASHCSHPHLWHGYRQLDNEAPPPPYKCIRRDPQPESVYKCTVYSLVFFYFHCISRDIHRCDCYLIIQYSTHPFVTCLPNSPNLYQCQRHELWRFTRYCILPCFYRQCHLRNWKNRSRDLCRSIQYF